MFIIVVKCVFDSGQLGLRSLIIESKFMFRCCAQINYDPSYESILESSLFKICRLIALSQLMG